MTGFEQLSDALHAGEEPNVLRNVFLIVGRGRVEDADPETRFDRQAIALQFDRFSVSMACSAEFDQVELLVDEQLPWPDVEITDISDDLPWGDIIDDCFLARFWKMANDKGCNDAIQLAFISADPDDTSEHIIQLEVVASQFYISRLDWGMWNYDPHAHAPDD